MADIYDEIKNTVAKWYNHFQDNPTVHKAETEAKAIEHSAVDYISKNGLQAFYQICVAVLTGAATGTPWATVGATAVAQAEQAGIAIAKGAESIVLAQAQADLVAAGNLAAPTTGAVVAAPAA